MFYELYYIYEKNLWNKVKENKRILIILFWLLFFFTSDITFLAFAEEITQEAEIKDFWDFVLIAIILGIFGGYLFWWTGTWWFIQKTP